MMEIPHSFLEDEQRLGFYIPSIVKCSFAAQLKIYMEIADICEKYNIEYFAEWGTLLGTIRHEGFIPWDDDFDICMKRKDYMEFLKHTDELPMAYRVLNFYTEPDYDSYMTRITNGSGIDFSREYLLQNYGFPYVAGIDIFVLDYVAPLKEELDSQLNHVNNLRCQLSALEQGIINNDELKSLFNKTERMTGVSLDSQIHNKLACANQRQELIRKVRVAIDNTFAVYREGRDEKGNESSQIALMPIYTEYKTMIFPRRYYECSISRPFEMTTIPVSLYYDDILKAKYGEYMRSVKKGGSHDYPYFTAQEQIYEAKGNRPQYKCFLTKADIRPCRNAGEPEAKKRALQITELIKRVHEKLSEPDKFRADEMLLLYSKCQELAIRLGEIIESSVGEGSKAVSLLEEYCEHLYNISNGEGNIGRENALIDEVKRLIENEIHFKKVAVFLPYKASAWDSLNPLWEEKKNDKDYITYVIPIPYYEKNPDGSLGNMHYEKEGYPENVPVSDYVSYKLENEHPDEIYIHNPYDEYNPATTVHPIYYSSKLRECTNILTYTPYLQLKNSDFKDERTLKNLRNFAVMPAAFYADRIVLESEDMKQTYFKLLTEYAGEETQKNWENKLTDIDAMKLCRRKDTEKNIPAKWLRYLRRADGSFKKIVLYRVSEGSFYSNEDRAIKKIRRVLKLFSDKKEEIALIYSPNPSVKESIKVDNPMLYNEYEKLVEEYRTNDFGIYDDSSVEYNRAELADAYYGDADSLVPYFESLRKPVMLANPKIDI